jgi:hypothetical protein
MPSRPIASAAANTSGPVPGTSALNVICRQVGLAENVLQDAAALVERFVAEVMAVEHRQIKSKERQALGLS